MVENDNEDATSSLDVYRLITGHTFSLFVYTQDSNGASIEMRDAEGMLFQIGK